MAGPRPCSNLSNSTRRHRPLAATPAAAQPSFLGSAAPLERARVEAASTQSSGPRAAAVASAFTLVCPARSPSPWPSPRLRPRPACPGHELLIAGAAGFGKCPGPLPLRVARAPCGVPLRGVSVGRKSAPISRPESEPRNAPEIWPYCLNRATGRFGGANFASEERTKREPGFWPRFLFPGGALSCSSCVDASSWTRTLASRPPRFCRRLRTHTRPFASQLVPAGSGDGPLATWPASPPGAAALRQRLAQRSARLPVEAPRCLVALPSQGAARTSVNPLSATGAPPNKLATRGQQ